MKALKIYEVLDFERGQEPKHSMGVGQDYIKQIIVDLFPKRNPGERDYELHQNLINVLLKPQFIVSIDKGNNIITVRNTDKKITHTAFESLFDVMIDHINLYSFPLKPKIARIVDPMAASMGRIELKIFKE
jgi:hypothetical protein